MSQEYFGTKRVTAWPQTRNPDGPDGYAVQYADGYTSWSPKDVFEAAYQPVTAMSFGHALVALRAGDRVCRAGWNGKGMWLVLIDYTAYTTVSFAEDVNIPVLPWIGMKTADGSLVPWLASQTDMLADDWMIVFTV